MARTLKGNLTGAAAVTDRREYNDYLYDSWIRQERAKLQARVDELMRLCYMIEGDAFIEWWDDDRNVPPRLKKSEEIKILENRIGGYLIPMPVRLPQETQQ